MKRTHMIPAGLETAAAALALGASGAAVATPSVTVRIEGRTRTLLPVTPVSVPSTGWLTRDGAPSGACPADSAAGALDAATRGNWSAGWSPRYRDYVFARILGDSEGGGRSYWEILVNNVAAPAGACAIRPRPGQQILFAAVPLSSRGEALVVRAPRTATRGSAFQVTVDFDVKGRLKPLAGATVAVGRGHGTSGPSGTLRLTLRNAGTFTLVASKAGYIRGEATIAVR